MQKLGTVNSNLHSATQTVQMQLTALFLLVKLFGLWPGNMDYWQLLYLSKYPDIKYYIMATILF